jgi:hypothetical protein
VQFSTIWSKFWVVLKSSHLSERFVIINALVCTVPFCVETGTKFVIIIKCLDNVRTGYRWTMFEFFVACNQFANGSLFSTGSSSNDSWY